MIRTLLSLIALLALCAIPNLASAALLAFDVNDRTEGETTSNPGINTAPGFSPWVMTASPSSTAVVDGYTVTFNVFDDGNPNDGGAAGNQAGAFDDRDRVSPTGTPTLNQLYDDFIFAGASAGPAGGLDMSISGGALLPNTNYRVSIYSFDGINASGGSAVPNREAVWLDGNNGDALVLTVNFATNVHPTTDDQYKFTGIATTDVTGALFLKGRRVSATNNDDLAVYVNGVVVEAIPEPASLVTLGAGLFALLLSRGCRKV
jgi:hypothetical protein